eukprot:385075_1
MSTPAPRTAEFWARAVSDYNASAENELDLREGDHYSVIDTTDDGWWYALDRDGVDGWCPSTYLDKVSPQKNAQLQRDYERQVKEREEKAREATYHNFDPNEETIMEDNTTDPNALKNELIASANSFAKRMAERERYSNIIAANKEKQKAAAQNSSNPGPLRRPMGAQQSNKKDNPYWAKYKYDNATGGNRDTHIAQVNARSNYMWSKKERKGDKFAYQKKLQEEKAQKMRKRLFYDEISAEEKGIDDAYRPELKSIQINTAIAISQYIHKQYNRWSIDELLHWLIRQARISQDTFQLASVLGVLAEKCKDNLATKRYALKNNALNILLYVLYCGGDKSVATSNSVCRAMTTLCEATNIVIQYPCEKAAVFYLCTAVRNSFRNPIFCCHALNCVVNFVKRNPTHRQYIITDAHNAKLVALTMEAMELFRYASNHTKLVHCTKVQIGGCLVLQNIAAHPIGSRLVGPAGVEVILDTFVAHHIENDAVAAAALSALSSLCVSNTNANAFLEVEGLSYVSQFLDNEFTSVKCRLLICRILHNMSCDPFLSRTLIDEYTGATECVVMKLVAYAEYGTDLYLAILRFLRTLLQEINKSKLEFMKDLLEQTFVQMLIDALQYNYAIESAGSAKYKKCVMNIYDHIVIILNHYHATGDEMCCAFIVDEEENETHCWIPALLISLATQYHLDAAHMMWQILKLLDRLSANSVQMQRKLIEKGHIVSLLLHTQWYTMRILDPDAVRLGANLLYKLLQSWPYYKNLWRVADDIHNINTFVQYLQTNHPNYSSQRKNIERQLRYIG